MIYQILKLLKWFLNLKKYEMLIKHFLCINYKNAQHWFQIFNADKHGYEYTHIHIQNKQISRFTLTYLCVHVCIRMYFIILCNKLTVGRAACIWRWTNSSNGILLWGTLTFIIPIQTFWPGRVSYENRDGHGESGGCGGISCELPIIKLLRNIAFIIQRIMRLKHGKEIYTYTCKQYAWLLIPLLQQY